MKHTKKPTPSASSSPPLRAPPAPRSIGPGQPTKLTPVLRARMLKLLRDGMFIQTACAACHVTRQSLWAWRKADPAFSDEFDAAQADGVIELHNVIRDAALKGKDVGAASWLLARMQPRLYAAQLRMMVDAELEKWAKRLATVLPPDVMRMVDEASESFMSGAGENDLDPAWPVIGPSPEHPPAA